ncbi:MAG: restriction endonuclease [Candidatus Bathyarchaeia archaeon]
MIVKNKEKNFVRKFSGVLETYDRNKLKKSCIKAGASEIIADKIVKEFEEKFLYNGITTKEIHDRIYELLEKESLTLSSKYRLKEAMMKLGPEGFHFEDFFARIMEHYGYKTRLRNLVRGRCALHEIDIMAEKNVSGKVCRCMIECKYHNSPGIYTGLKEALYTYARFLDLKDGWHNGLCENFDEAWLVTNTKFSEEAKAYIECKGIKAVGWKYPKGQGLEILIENKTLYPITVLKSVNKEQLRRFSEINIIIIKDILKKSVEELVNTTGIPKGEILILKNEVKNF